MALLFSRSEWGFAPSPRSFVQTQPGTGRPFPYVELPLHHVGTHGLQRPLRQSGAHVAEEPAKPYGPRPQPRTGAQPKRASRTQNFEQAGDFYRSLSAEQKKHLVSNVAGDIGQVADEDVLYKMLAYFYKADAAYGRAVGQALNADVSRMETLAASLAD